LVWDWDVGGEEESEGLSEESYVRGYFLFYALIFVKRSREME
jgi:hypothetical protein